MRNRAIERIVAHCGELSADERSQTSNELPLTAAQRRLLNAAMLGVLALLLWYVLSLPPVAAVVEHPVFTGAVTLMPSVCQVMECQKLNAGTVRLSGLG